MDFVTLVSTVGFPIAAYAWQSYELKKTIQKNTDAVNLLAVAVATCPAKKRGNPAFQP